MINRFLTAITSLILSSSMFPLCVGAQDLTPESREMDCGEMLFNKPATYTLELKNTTGKAVEIKDIDTGCGCTTANFTKGRLMPNAKAQVSLTFDAKQLGHFSRVVRVFTEPNRGGTPTEIVVSGVVVTKIENYSGEYPCRMGSLLADKDNVEYDDVNKGQKLTQEIHIMNPSSQNATPVVLRLPSYLTAEVTPKVLGPRQKGTVKLTLHSNKLLSYGLNQTTVYLGKNRSDKVSPEKVITVSAILLPPAIAKDDVKRAVAPRLEMSRKYIDMTPLASKSKYKDEVTLSNNGRTALEIQSLQLFTTGINVSLDKKKIEPGETAKLTVTCKAKDLKKLRMRPRILMITNDPNHQKVVLEIKR